jgi:chemotaxis protein methyltransferase CheR
MGRAKPARPVHTMSVHDENMSTRDYTRLCDLIYAQAGIRLGSDKKTMLEVRIKRRLKALDLSSYDQYCNYLFGRQGLKEELVSLIDVVTTNKTDFFREPGHFNFLVEKALPELTLRDGGGRPLLIWSAGCSTGEEPYTLAMVLSEYGLTHSGFRFRILATDICTDVLAKAEMGVYSSDVVSPVPAVLRRKYLMGSKEPGSNRVRVVPELRRLVEFRRLNFMDADYGIPEKADAIFCRNVIIYFDRTTQEQVLKKLSRHLAPRGYMFVGHAETLHDMDLPLAPVAPALYRRVDA